MAGSTKTYALWAYFSVAEDTPFAICNECNASISRGGNSTKSFNASNLLFHLRTKHQEQYEAEKKQGPTMGQAVLPKTNQLSLESSMEFSRV